MARLTHSDRITTSQPPDLVRIRLLQAFTAMGARVLNSSDVYIEARTGSQVATRVKGGMIARGQEYPIRTSLTLAPSPTGGTYVDVTCVDDLSLGLKIGMKAKYAAAFLEMVSRLRDAVHE